VTVHELGQGSVTMEYKGKQHYTSVFLLAKQFVLIWATGLYLDTSYYPKPVLVVLTDLDHCNITVNRATLLLGRNNTTCSEEYSLFEVFIDLKEYMWCQDDFLDVKLFQLTVSIIAFNCIQGMTILCKISYNTTACHYFAQHCPENPWLSFVSDKFYYQAAQKSNTNLHSASNSKAYKSIHFTIIQGLFFLY